MLGKVNAIFEPKPSDGYWVKQVKSIPEFDDFDVEFGKRFLLALLALPDGEKKFMSFMCRAQKSIDHYLELEALDLTDEEEELFDDLEISKTLDKYLRTKGWKTYGTAMGVGGAIGIIDALFYYTHLQHINNPEDLYMTFFSSPYHLIAYPAFEILICALLCNTASHEIDDLKYEELQRAVLTLTEKFSGVFIEDSVTNVRTTNTYTRPTQPSRWYPM
jgi:hypothetical protein